MNIIEYIKERFLYSINARIKNRIIHELIKISLHNSKSYRRFEGEREREKDGNPFYLGCHRLYLFLSPRWTRPAGHFQAGEKLQRFVPYEKYGNARGLILDTSFSLSFPPSHQDGLAFPQDF